MYNFYYDPSRRGYDTNYWKTLTGSPSTSGDNLRLSGASIIHLGDVKGGYHTFKINVPTISDAQVTGGTAATSTLSTWQSVGDGEFSIDVDGETYNIVGLDFSSIASMSDVAAVIEEELQNQVGVHMKVIWNSDHFEISGGQTLSYAYTYSGGSGTDISGAGTTEYMDADSGSSSATKTDGSLKIFGLYSNNKEEGMTMEIRGTRIFFKTISGGVTQVSIIDWDSFLEGAMNNYEFSWGTMSPAFKINGKVKAIHDDVCPKGPLSWHVDNNADADNLDVALFEAQEAESYTYKL